MPDLLDPADSGRGDRPLTVVRSPWSVVSRDKQTSTLTTDHPPLTTSPLLLCERVSKWYGPVIGVNQVTLELRPGITGLVGSNGAGKSTLMGLITGHLRPDLGRITRDRAAQVLETVGMEGRAERRVRGYSKGMRQRVKMAQALVHDPELLVLDEPLSGIDPVGRAEFIALFHRLAERGKALLVSSHELDELEKLTDHIAILARGRVAVIGSVAQIRDRLDDHPLTIRIDLNECEDRGSPSLSGEPLATLANRRRELAAALLRLPEVAGVDLTDTGVLARARNPQRFFRDFTKLVLEEWYEISHMETLDDSTEAVLSYLLGGAS